MGKGNVISDLHMMAAYSQSNKYWAAIDQAASKANFFILNGDLNEMYFSDLPFEERLQRAVTNIELLVRTHPNCQFHYLIGNHENIDAYYSAIKDLARSVPNLQIHDSVYRMPNALFLHGDQPLNHGEITFERHFHSAKGMKQKAAGALLPLVNPLQAKYRDLRHVLRYSFNRDVGRVLNALEGAEPTIKDGLEYVFFAHTHRPKMDVSTRHSDIKFYNTGAGVRGARFSLLELDTDDHERITAVREISPILPFADRVDQPSPGHHKRSFG